MTQTCEDITDLQQITFYGECENIVKMYDNYHFNYNMEVRRLLREQQYESFNDMYIKKEKIINEIITLIYQNYGIIHNVTTVKDHNGKPESLRYIMVKFIYRPDNKIEIFYSIRVGATTIGCSLKYINEFIFTYDNKLNCYIMSHDNLCFTLLIDTKLFNKIRELYDVKFIE